MADRQVTPDDAEMNHEAVVEDYFNSLDAEEAPETPVEEPEAVEEEETTPEAVEDADEASEEPSDEEEADETSREEVEEEEEDLDPVEKRIRGMQSLHDRQMNEVKAQLEQMNQWAQNVYQSQLQAQQAQLQAQQAAAQQVPQVIPVTREELEGAVESDPKRAFVWTAQNRPDLMATTIAVAREKHGHEVADAMQLEFNDYQRKQEMARVEERFTAQQQQQVERDAPQQIEGQLVEIMNSVAEQYGDAFTSVQTEFVERAQESAPLFKAYMDEQGYEMTPDAVRHFLVQTLQDVREEKLNAQASAPRKPRKLTPQETVETSTDGTSQDPSADELAINELLEGAKLLDMDISTPTQ